MHSKHFFISAFLVLISLVVVPEGNSEPVQVLAGASAVPIAPVDREGNLWEEPYEDLNGNQRYDAPDPSHPGGFSEPFQDLNRNGKWDGPFLAGFHHFGPYYTATGVHDMIWSRALVIQVGAKKMALVALDLVGFFFHHVEEIRDRVEDLGFSQVIIASTHTHGGPDSIGLWGPNRLTDGKDPRFIDHIKTQTIRALQKADADLRPARLRFGQTAVSVQGDVLINDFRDPIVIDDRLLVLQAMDTEHKPIATLVNWTPHPETMGGTSSLISSDFPHYVRKGIEEGGFRVRGRRYDGVGGIAIYLSGAVGGLLTTLDIPIRDEDGRVLPERSWGKTRRIGELAAAAALDAIEGQPYETVSGLGTAAKKIFIPLDNPLFRLLSRKGVLNRTTYSKGQADREGRDILTEVDLVSFKGPEGIIAQMATVPGELFPEMFIGGFLKDSDRCWKYTQRKRRLDQRGRERIAPAHPEVPHEENLREKMKGAYRFLIGLGNDELGYIVPANDFVPPVMKPKLRYGTDRCGDSDHYEETMSASSKMGPLVTGALAELMEQPFK